MQQNRSEVSISHGKLPLPWETSMPIEDILSCQRTVKSVTKSNDPIVQSSSPIRLCILHERLRLQLFFRNRLYYAYLELNMCIHGNHGDLYQAIACKTNQWDMSLHRLDMWSFLHPH